MIRNGKICEPVRGASLIGTGSQILQDIDMVGQNLATGQGVCGSASGSVPTDEAEENAIMMAGIMPLKNLTGLRRPSVLTENEYTTTACTT